MDQIGYPVVNLLGLTLGFACFLLLNFYVSSEKNFDWQHGHVYRLLQETKDENGEIHHTAVNPPRTGTFAVVDVCRSGCVNDPDCGTDGGFSEYEGCAGKSGGFVETGLDSTRIEGMRHGFVLPHSNCT